jgi:hypothetical protein
VNDQPFPLSEDQVKQALENAKGEYSQLAGIASLLRLLLMPPDPPPRPARPFESPGDAAKQAFWGMWWLLKDAGAPDGLAWVFGIAVGSIVGAGGALGAVALWLLKHVGAEFAIDVLQLVDEARKAIDPTVAVMSVAVLNELLGTDFTADHLATGEDVAAHLARASEVGGLFHSQLIGEFKADGDVTPEAGVAAAKRMTGFLVNFGTATALISIAGDLASFGKFEQFRELGVEVARNLGLGRMHRQVMKPLINTLISAPYQWFLNQQFHPTQFKAPDLVNPFTQELMPHDAIFKALDLEGFSQDKIELLIKLHSKKRPLADLELFDRYGIVPRDETLNAMRELGYPDDISEVVLEAVDLHRADAALAKLVDTAETSVVDGHLTLDDFSALLDALPLGHHEKAFRLKALDYKSKSPHAHLTTAQAQKAFEEGIWTLDDLSAYFTARGYSATDNATLQLITLLALAKLEEAKKVAQAAYDKKVAAAKKKGEPPPPPPAILVG